MAGGAGPLPQGGAQAPTLSIVIPAYNEEVRLSTLLETLAGSAGRDVSAAGFELVETLIVDDGSTDRTREMLVEAGRSTDKVRPVLEFDSNRGKGAAVAAGAARAQGDLTLLADVDLSTPLGELTKLAAAIGAGADLAIGSRAVEGAVVERGPSHRKLMGKAFNATVRAMTGLDVRDTQNGFKLMSTGVAKELLGSQQCSGFAFDVELLMRAKQMGLSIAEVPVTYIHDPRSRVRVVGATFEMLKEVSRLAYRLRLQQRPAGSSGRTESSLRDLPANNPD